MKHHTNESLIEKQVAFWNEDFYDPNDPISIDLEPEAVSISDISWNQAIADMYHDEDNRASIEALKKALQEGSALPPLLTDKHNHLIDGYHRLIALKELGEAKTLIIRLNKRFNDTDTPLY